MDGSRFDAWTRRRCGLAAASALVSLIGLGAGPDARAKRKKKRKKRGTVKRKRQCEKLRTRCNPDNDRKTCCPGLGCAIVPVLGGHHCCRWRFGACEDDGDCCGQLTCNGGPGGFCDSAAR